MSDFSVVTLFDSVAKILAGKESRSIASARGVRVSCFVPRPIVRDRGPLGFSANPHPSM